MTAPVASGWSLGRVGFFTHRKNAAFLTAHTHSRDADKQKFGGSRGHVHHAAVRADADLAHAALRQADLLSGFV